MKKTKFLSSLKNNIDKVHSVLNFSIPEKKVVTYKDPDGNNFNNIKRDNHASLYIGKMFHDNEGIYNEETMQWMLHYAAQKLRWPDEKIFLQIAGDVYDLFASDEENDRKPMSTVEQKQALEKIIARDKTLKDRVELCNIADRHRPLFDAISSGGIQALAEEQTEWMLEKEDLNSKDIATYLYKLCQDYPAVNNLFVATLPEKVKGKNDTNFSAYALVEVAIRMDDLLHGITLQGWVERQNVYDQLIMFFTGQSKDNIPHNVTKLSPIRELQERCQNKLHESNLKQWHFKNKQFLALLPKEQEKERLQKKIKNIIIISSIALSSVLAGTTGTYMYMKNQEAATYEEKQKELLKQKLKYEKLGVWFHYNMDYGRYESDEKKIELVESTTNRIYRYILKRYSIDPSQEKALRGIIQNELLQKNSFWTGLVINDVNRDMDQASRYAYDFIQNHLIAHNKIALEAIGMDTRPYSNLLPHKLLFQEATQRKDTVLVENWSIKNNIGDGHTALESLWVFSSKSYDKEYELIKVTVDKQNSFESHKSVFIVAKNIYSGDDIYSTTEAKIVANELLLLRDQDKE